MNRSDYMGGGYTKPKIFFEVGDQVSATNPYSGEVLPAPGTIIEFVEIHESKIEEIFRIRWSNGTEEKWSSRYLKYYE